MPEWVINLVGAGGMGAFSAWCLIAFKAGKYIEKIEKLEKEIFVIGEIRERLAKVEARQSIISDYILSKSPLSLTEQGNMLLSDSGFKTIFENVKDDLIKRFFEEINPKTQYDTQERSLQWMDDLSRKEYEPFAPIKSFAFKSGSDYAQILRAGSILLRDYYLEKHPEIKD